jgi:Fe2+ or Zn2+ uptake regulation protein
MDPCAQLKAEKSEFIFWRAHGMRKMSKKHKRPRTSQNQRKILDILNKYHELSAKDIAEILWARDITYNTPEFASVHRSLTALYERGLVEKIGGKLKWRKTRKVR